METAKERANPADVLGEALATFARMARITFGGWTMNADELRERALGDIKKRADHWRELLKRTRERLALYERDKAISHALYRIYTREDRQGPQGIERPFMKAEAKIIEEFVLRRMGGTRFRSGKSETIDPDPSFDIFQITDIIGVTVVCPFDSDVALVAARIINDSKNRDGFVYKDDKVHGRDNYKAHHVYVTIDADPMSDLTCEIQIKTAIQDAFGWKTHSLAYKPDPLADGWFITQFERIGQVLRVADSLSDELRKRQQVERSIGDAKRASARESLTANIASRVASIPDPRLRSFVQQSITLIDEAKAFDGQPRFDKLQHVERSVEKEFKDFGYSTDAFRVATLCAICWNRLDKTYWLERLSHKWFDDRELNGVDGFEDADCRNFVIVAMMCMMAPYILGDLSTAIDLGTRAHARVAKLRGEMVSRLIGNMAYFSAELASQRPSDRKFAERARDYANLAEQAHAPLSPQARDTLGYVRIQTGSDVVTVENGLTQCREAYDAIQADAKSDEKAKAVSTNYFELHRELAYRRLADLSK